MMARPITSRLVSLLFLRPATHDVADGANRGYIPPKISSPTSGKPFTLMVKR
jgi:hypothetical protein